ncbi:4-hydroxy-tetrahydrodipicolinate synthase [Hyella patelloides LEGE 07179]|uniref:4-hydroxy-tetrahydrodipicolinate synthase n=1 Tax=Hyella patelloides LEGE 07179 TaxID=945734 RepID=A0A563VKT8_9CYAN|nr:4-hydroxy-tetrahydrodipicolinate synthase [Hyella patelloides]VEP12076.1 4-hydroxy-tetrahydrodipicolinate synthase [Hyella patelloides LEGE 07179]
METISGSIVALVTPFNEDKDQTVNLDKLEELIHYHADRGTSGVLVCGTTGESPTLNHQEHEQVIYRSTQVAKERGIKIVAGTGSNSTIEAVRLTTHAAQIGVDACLIVTPYYNKPTPAGLMAHFQELDSVGIPLIAYNIPGRTGINITPSTFIELAHSCQNIVGLKASNGNLDEITETAYLLRALPRSCAIYSGDDSLTLPILAVGGIGVISVAANILPKTMSQLVHEYRSKNVDKARLIAQNIHGFCRSLLKVGANPAPIKAVMNMAGMQVGSVRKPIVEISPEQAALLVTLNQKMAEDFTNTALSYEGLNLTLPRLIK